MIPNKIAISAKLAPQLCRELAVPHTLALLHDEGDAAIARILADSEIFVTAAFKAAWRSPNGSRLRLVHVVGAGLDAIDFGSLPPGCRVCNVFGHERAVTEQAFTLMFGLQKRLLQLDRALRDGDWTPQCPYLPEMRGRHLLILGFGHIGQELARWGHFLEMNVTVLTRTPGRLREGPGPRYIGGLDELDTHLPDADFVVIAIPATPETVDLVHDRQLQLMKPTSFIINIGRAAVINETALYETLRTRRIAGAGLDVWYQYPVPGQKRLPARAPFHELENVIMTPHKPTIETMAYRWSEIAKNIARLARGEPLVNQVWPPPDANG